MRDISELDAVAIVKLFIEEYENWEEAESRRRYGKLIPNYEVLGNKYYEAYKTAKKFGF